MRKVIVVGLLAGCAREPVPGVLHYRSTFEGETKGLVLHETGDGGHAGMFETNCPFETVNGTVTGDYDLPGEGEDVQDGEATTLGDITLAAILLPYFHVLDKTDGIYTHVEVEVPEIHEGRLTTDGIVAITLGCELSWRGFDGTVLATTTVDQCGGDIETDPVTGETVVSDLDGTVITDGQETVESAVDGDLVAYDDAAEVFYVAARGQDWLAAVERDGSARWTVQTPGRVSALDDGGATGTANVVLALESGKGALAVYDGRTGEEVYYAETPAPADDLSVSGNGKVVALVRAEQVFFYDRP